VLDRSQVSQRSSVELNHMEWETVAPFLLTRGDRCDARNVHEGRDELSRGPGLPELIGDRLAARGRWEMRDASCDTWPGWASPGGIHVSVDIVSSLVVRAGTAVHMATEGRGRGYVWDRYEPSRARSACSRALPAWHGPRESLVQIPR
jgi:hypothetical protein